MITGLDESQVRQHPSLGGKQKRAGRRQLRRLLEHQKFKCALTGVELTPNNSALDHKVPVSLGGTHEIGNLQWVTKAANLAKGGLTMEQFYKLCKRVETQWQERMESGCDSETE